MDPATVANEPDPWLNAVRYAAAIIYDQADAKADQEAKAKAQRK